MMGFALSSFADDFSVVDVFDVRDPLGDLRIDARSECPVLSSAESGSLIRSKNFVAELSVIRLKNPGETSTTTPVL